MKILAIEFSPPQRSVAVVADVSAFEVVEDATRNTNALGMIEKVLLEAGCEREKIECIAIGIGPGSYTGIRAAISFAQGWQLAGGVKILGISSAEGIAAQAQAEGMRGPVSVVIDAQRNEFYRARYELGAEGCLEIEPLQIVTLAEMQACEQAGEVLIGPDLTRWFSRGQIILPRATTLAALAASRSDFVAGEKLEPIYLRETAFVKAPPLRVIS